MVRNQNQIHVPVTGNDCFTLSVNMSESILWNNVLTTVYTDSYFILAMFHVSYSADVLGLGSDDTALSS